MGLKLDFFQLFGLIIFCQIALFHFCYFYSVRIKDFSKIDLVWSLSAWLMAFLTLSNGHNLHLKSLIIFLLISAWAFRLFFYLLKRNRNTGEDFRYQQWRKEWGEKANSIAYVRVFWLQTVLSLAIFYPVIFILYYTPADWEVFDLISLTLFVLGLVIEIVADGQKFAFKSNPANKGKLLDQGLWAFSRHPNYFGESLLWWGFFGFSLSAGTSFFNFWGPALLTFFLIKVSGVAMLEKAKENDPEYQEYRQRVSSFIPWFPKTK